MNAQARAAIGAEQRAYSLFEVKALDDGRRTFTGWATTPATDRVGDTINPLGATFKNPLSLLHQHKHDRPIGTVVFKKPTAKGIEFTAEIPRVDVADSAELAGRCDTAWGELKYGLVRAVSIGFKPIKYAFKEDGGVEFQEVEIFELSTVSIPALPEAVITSVKSMHPMLPRDVVQLIRRHDAALARGTVPLIQVAKSVEPPLPNGAVRLILP
jgi:HK97 family phage prohead protease